MMDYRRRRRTFYCRRNYTDNYRQENDEKIEPKSSEEHESQDSGDDMEDPPHEEFIKILNLIKRIDLKKNELKNYFDSK